MPIHRWKMLKELADLGLQMFEDASPVTLFSILAQPALVSRIIEAQLKDGEIKSIHTRVSGGKDVEGWTLHSDGCLRYRGMMFVLLSCCDDVLWDFHHSQLTVHPGGTKMYHNLRRQFWWKGMKWDVSQLVARCLTCQQVKVKQQRPAGLL
ncbi:uncharacterized protein LOC132280931 [Cornus florida]|uniref:uncharacterized protein LOC132280931 n=1 Tax=Cornus florida TaxID=4283 RepID=UPI0028987B90|nr:uncharacterized protein LOC132280931 [Cornus florida]